MALPVTPEQIALLRQKVDSLQPVTDKDFNEFAGVLHCVKFKKGQLILKEGDVCRHLYFLLKGCIRSYTIEDGKEVNLRFFFERQVFSDFDSLRFEKTSRGYLVATESCVVLSAVKADFSPILLQSKSLLKFAFRFFQQLFIREQQHSSSFKLLSPEERYLYLREHEPHFLQRIPLTHLASYLGTSRETLSRIRKKNS